MKKDGPDRKAVQLKISNIIEKAGAQPCAVCAGKADAVGSFTPQHPEKFAMTSEDALYFSICVACLKEGLDLEFMEIQALASFGMPVGK